MQNVFSATAPTLGRVTNRERYEKIIVAVNFSEMYPIVPFALSLSKSPMLVSFDKLRTNGRG